MALSIRGSAVQALRSGMADDCMGSVLVHESYFTERGGEGNVFANVHEREQRMKFQWFEEHYIDGGYHPAEAEIRKVVMTGRMLDGDRQKPIHVDEFGTVVDVDAEPLRTEVRRVLDRSWSIVVQGRLKDHTDNDLSRETRRIIGRLRSYGEMVRGRAALRMSMTDAETVIVALGSDPGDGVRLLERVMGYDAADCFVRSVMGVTE